jgi:hypothetical protein
VDPAGPAGFTTARSAETIGRSAEDVLEVLLDTFSDRRGVANKLAHFFARRQSRTETIPDFALGMQAAAAVINEEQEGAVSEAVLTNTFV